MFGKQRVQERNIWDSVYVARSDFNRSDKSGKSDLTSDISDYLTIKIMSCFDVIIFRTPHGKRNLREITADGCANTDGRTGQ